MARVSMLISSDAGANPAEATLSSRAFGAMNTVVRVIARGGDVRAAFDDAEREFTAFEARFSRFRDDSESSRLNRSGGHPFAASGEMIALLELAAAMRARTGGVFDPCVLPALEAAGYDRSFEQVARDGGDDAAGSGVLAPCGDGYAIDGVRATVRLSPGARVDLGGIGKGYCIDRVMGVIAPLRDFVVDAGGDVAARGDGPDGRGWVVSVADPFDETRDIGVVRLYDEAIATSTTMRRRWRRGGEVRHHIIDPQTGRSAVSDLVQVSVVARSAAAADVYAKCALILGSRDGAELIRDAGMTAMFVDADGRRSTIGEWPGVD
jgi:thiamine biosynthesis lipoprotein